MSGPDLPGYGTKTEPDDGPTCPVCDAHLSDEDCYHCWSKEKPQCTHPAEPNDYLCHIHRLEADIEGCRRGLLYADTERGKA